VIRLYLEEFWFESAERFTELDRQAQELLGEQT
jgi:hypothetical protein